MSNLPLELCGASPAILGPRPTYAAASCEIRLEPGLTHLRCSKRADWVGAQWVAAVPLQGQEYRRKWLQPSACGRCRTPACGSLAILHLPAPSRRRSERTAGIFAAA